MEKFKLEKRGCDFFAGDDIANYSDVTNYRVGVYSYDIPGKDGRDYIVEFHHFDRYETRTTHKRTGAPLKHPKRELQQKNALCIDTQYEKDETDSTGRRWRSCWRNSALEAEVHALHLPYTIEGIEKALEYITGKEYCFDGFTS